ncbi:RNA-guided endonuclease IscB [Streptomyces sp. NPDC127051]|uniref:RNA-guided endonuclease IscB n=1 Tax=Streptomyces sp. NPDC127051 TaxID=3347119 RepID=UPI003646E4DE
MPCHPARARELLDRGRAVVARQAPFTIRLKHRTRADSTVDGVQLRIDPGSRATGIAITDERHQVGPTGRTHLARRGLITIELRHRGRQIHSGMMRRAGYRRRRRSANLRYRAPRHDNRRRPNGWLAPSLRHRVDSTTSLVSRLCRYAPVVAIHVEHAAFDTAAVAGGMPPGGPRSLGSTCAGFEIREFLLAKWKRSCAYCGAEGVPLNIEHVRPRSGGGSDRLSNLVLACVTCNQAKGTSSIEEFLADRPARLERVIAQLRRPLHDMATMNSTRLTLVKALGTIGVPVHTWSSGRTHWNRRVMGLPKSHTLDALATGVIDHERGGHPCPRPHAGPGGDRGGAWFVRKNHAGPFRVPPPEETPRQDAPRVRDRRPGGSGRSSGAVGRQVRRAYRCPEQRSAPDHDADQPL